MKTSEHSRTSIRWLALTFGAAAIVLPVLWWRAQSTLSAAQTRISSPNAGAKSDGTARQTAPAWRGSPLEFEYPNRDQTLLIEDVMNALQMRPGSKVADVGAGGGWFMVRASRRVGPTGRVYAQEILPKFTRFLKTRAKREGLKNVRVILGTPNDPKLPANTMDAVLILNAYHEFEQPLAMLRKIRAAMKPGARLAFIERDDETLREEARQAYATTGKIKRRVDERPDQNPQTDDHRLALDIVEREAARVGLRKVTSFDLNDDHYLLVVTRD